MVVSTVTAGGDSKSARRHHLRAVFLGPPGSGKGTQAALVCEKMGLVRAATGDMLREAVKSGSELGKSADAHMKAGKLVPDELVMRLLFERLNRHDCLHGYVLDGFPRNVNQAIKLEQEGFSPDVVLNFQIADEKIVARIDGRLVCEKCGTNFHKVFRVPKKDNVCDLCSGKLIVRKDDNPQTVRERLKVFHQDSDAAIDFYRKRGVLHDLNADLAVEAVTEIAVNLLEKSRPSPE